MPVDQDAARANPGALLVDGLTRADAARLAQLMRRTLAWLELDLTGLVVLTEAASGPFVVTSVMAALAGAQQVWAVTRNSQYAAATTVIAQTKALARLCGVEGRIALHTERAPELFSSADIVTNLGFVRPLNAAVVSLLKPTAVVALMYEAWEHRAADVDLAACQVHGIAVLGTNEDYPGLEVFDYSGWLCLKMLMGAQVEPPRASVAVVSSDKFGTVISRRLAQLGMRVSLLPHLRGQPHLHDVDAIVVADYLRDDTIIGQAGDITPQVLAERAPAAVIVQFAGQNDARALLDAGLRVYPARALPAHRMAFTLAGLGPRPVVELHAAGLKAAELAARVRLAGQTLRPDDQVLFRGHPLAQVVGAWVRNPANPETDRGEA